MSCGSPIDNNSADLTADSTRPETKDSLSTKYENSFAHMGTIKQVVFPPSPLFFHGKSSTLMAETLGQDTSIYHDGSYSNIAYRGYVCLLEMNFSGGNVPFVCTVSKNVKALYVNGKKIRFKPDQEFFFRQEIPLFLGYNRIPVKIINKRKEQTEGYIEINMVSTK